MMKVRCDNKNYHAYPAYGGAGITYCEKWKEFEGFYEDMGDPPEGCTLDRIGGATVYSKETCRWATKREQALNRANAKIVEFRGESYYLADLITWAGLSYSTVHGRLQKGWSIEEALQPPTTKRTKKCKAQSPSPTG